MPAPAAGGRRDGQSISDIGAVRGLVLASKVEARRVTPEPLEEPRGSRGNHARAAPRRPDDLLIEAEHSSFADPCAVRLPNRRGPMPAADRLERPMVDPV